MTAYPSDPEAGSSPGLVRPYARTGGRTRPAVAYALEAMVQTLDDGQTDLTRMGPEHREIATLCRYSLSVAEVSAILTMPIGVVRVLLGDMTAAGVVTVHDRTAEASSDRPDTALMERVLHGLQRL